jgi:hypothetical protein
MGRIRCGWSDFGPQILRHTDWTLRVGPRVQVREVLVLPEARTSP